MSGLDHERLTHLLAEAVELPENRRHAFLDSACAGEPELRRELDDLLAYSAGASAAFDIASQHLVVSDPGRIGPYTLLEPIGEGGMAIVYKAQQQDPVKRTVAIKLIKLGMDTRQFVARFEAERQALAMMDHPNVAQVYDAGSTETGRPYFVMEYVPGERILEWCDKHQLTIPQRLELFISVCDAVEHAHRKGIIHRDIKNSNVLVTDIDGKPTAKVIDFGVAKALQRPLTDRTLQTEQGQLIGTPECMSPEQAERGTADIDTRADVYSLGVLLYELIAGVAPISSDVLRSGSYEQVQRIIRETDPPRPSTRLGALSGADATSIAHQRRTALPTLLRDLRIELEWIPLKAMRRDREERYRGAAELADDIRNYLDHRPLFAGPESTGYKLAKFLQRHKTGVAASAAMVLLLVAGIITTSWQAIRATKAEHTSRAALKSAQEANAQTRAVNDFLTLDVLWSAEPSVTRGRELSVRAALDNAALNVGSRFADRPRVEAAVRNTLAGAYRTLGHLDLALSHSQAAIDIVRRLGLSQDPEGLQIINDHGIILIERGDAAAAEPFFREVLQIRRRLNGIDDILTGESVGNLASAMLTQGKLAEAEPLVREGMRLAELHYRDEVFLPLSVARLATVFQRQGNFATAEPLLREAVAEATQIGGMDHPEVLRLKHRLGRFLQQTGNFSEAEQLLGTVLPTQRQVLGDDHPDTVDSMNSLALLLVDRGRFDDAEPLALEALERSRRVRGPDHPETIARINNLGRVKLYQGKLAEAEPLFREALAMARRVRGDEHEQTLAISLNLALVLGRVGKLEEAEPLLRQTMSIQQRVLGRDDFATIQSVNNLGGLLFEQRKFADAESQFRSALESKRRVFGDAHPETLMTLSNLGRAVRAQARHADAEPFFAELYRLTPTSQVPPRQAALFMSHWGPCLVQIGRYDAAEDPLRAALERLRATDQTHGEHMQRVLSALAEACERTGRREEANGWRADLEAVHAATRPG